MVKLSSALAGTGVPFKSGGSCMAKVRIPPAPTARFEATGLGPVVLIGNTYRFTKDPAGKPATLTLITVPGGPLTGFKPITGFVRIGCGTAVGTGVGASVR